MKSDTTAKTTLEEREFALSYRIETCLDVKFDSAELRAVREACRAALTDAFSAGKQEGWNDHKEVGNVR